MTVIISKLLAAALACSGQQNHELHPDAPRSSDLSARMERPIVQDPPSPEQVTEPSQPAPQLKNAFNPQISLVTDFRYNAINSDKSERKRAFLKEAELGFAADVDPFLKAEAYIAFADEDGESVTEVEEAFGKYTNLGKGLSAKFGKIAGAIGRVQRNHADQLNWMDYPLMVQDQLGEEGLRAGGGSLSYLLPGDRFHEFTLEVLDGKDKGIFAGSNAGSPVVIGAYRTFFDFNEDTSAQFGMSYAAGPSPIKNERSDLIAAEFTYKWQPGTSGRSLVFETEGYWGKQGGDSKRRTGAFAALTYEVKPRLFLTTKYDYSEVPGGSDIRKGVSFGATLKVTEFHYWRAEFQRIESNFAAAKNVLNLQFQWVIGAHPAHKY